MSTQIAVPVFCYAAPKIHQLNHTVTDATPGFICTETTGADSFSQNSVIRCKEIRCDRNNGKVRTTGLIVSNKNQVQSGSIVSDSAIYDDVGGFTTPKIVTFDNTSNNSALVVKSGGAYIGDGARINGNLTTEQITVTGATTFNDLVTANGGVYVPGAQQSIVTATTKIVTPEIDTGSSANLVFKRNSDVMATLEANSLTLNTGCYLKYDFQPRFCAQLGYTHTATSAAVLINWTTVFIDNRGAFNTGNGRFTAPVAGHYRLTANSQSTTSSAVSLTMQVNDTNPGGISIFTSGTSTTIGVKPLYINVILNLAAGEYVTLVTGTTGSYSSRTMFTAELLSIT